MLLARFAGLSGEEDRSAAASYCGQKFGITSSDFQPCVNWYVNGNDGDYKPGSSGAIAPSTSTVTAATNIVSSLLPGSTMPTNPLLPAPTPWYKTPVGIGVIVLGVFVGYKLIGSKAKS